MSRISIKIVGASGQGINSIGEIVAKGLKRSGYCVFGYREYPDLIKGGHASYQLDISNERVRSTETKVNVLGIRCSTTPWPKWPGLRVAPAGSTRTGCATPSQPRWCASALACRRSCKFSDTKTSARPCAMWK